MMFPPNFLHNRLSAHYIEINHIFAVEMLKKYIPMRKELLRERDACTQEDRLTRYALNPDYVYEAMGEDCDDFKLAKSANNF